MLKENLLGGHPDGLDKHIHVCVVDQNIGRLCTERWVINCYRNDELPFFATHHGKKYLVILGSDLVLDVPDFPTTDWCRNKIQSLSHYVNLVADHLDWVVEDINFGIIGCTRV